MKKLLNRALRVICERKSNYFIWYLRKQGCIIGNNCKFYHPSTNFVDLTRPYLLELGENVKIARGVTLLTHGFEWVVLRELYNRPFGGCAPVSISKNVFIGMCATVLKGVTIGCNTIIGAGSIVSKSIPDNVVAAGNPCVPVATIDEYYNKVLSREVEEAKIQALKIKNNCGRLPTESDFYKSYFYQFIERDRNSYPDIIHKQVGSHWSSFLRSKPVFTSFNNFLATVDDSKTSKN